MGKTKPTLKNYGKKIVLVIDDDLDILANVREIFEMEDYHVLSASNGREAIEILGKLSDHELPNLILLDYMMPILNGDGFNTERLKIPRLCSIPVVLMTANGNINMIMNDVDVDAYIDKPMDINQMLRIAFNFIHRRESAKTSFLA